MTKRYEIYLITLSAGLTLLAHFKIYYSSMLNWHLPPVQIFIRNISIMVLFLIIYIVLKIMKFKGDLIPFIAMSFLTGISLSLNYRLGISSVNVQLFNTYILSITAGILSLPVILYYFRNNWIAKLKKRYYFLFGITVLGLFIWSVTSNILGEKFFFSRTPWELAKISIVFVTAGFLSEYSGIFDNKNNFLTLVMVLVCPLFVLWSVPQVLFAAMGDFGQIMIFSLFILFLVFTATGKVVYLIGGISLIFSFVYFIPFLSKILPGYAVERFEIWSDFWAGFPSSEWFNRIYQPLNSMFAVHSGGIFGTGLGMGYPYLIPKSSSDFIYSTLAEEVGFAGSFSVIIIYFSLIISGLISGFKCRDTFISYSVLGFSIIIGIQVFVNIAGVLNLIPLTGIPLPFLSKGGFAFITFSFMVGFIMSASETESFSKNKPQSQREAEKKYF